MLPKHAQNTEREDAKELLRSVYCIHCFNYHCILAYRTMSDTQSHLTMFEITAWENKTQPEK